MRTYHFWVVLDYSDNYYTEGDGWYPLMLCQFPYPAESPLWIGVVHVLAWVSNSAYNYMRNYNKIEKVVSMKKEMTPSDKCWSFQLYWFWFLSFTLDQTSIILLQICMPLLSLPPTDLEQSKGIKEWFHLISQHLWYRRRCCVRILFISVPH